MRPVQSGYPAKQPIKESAEFHVKPGAESSQGK